MILSENGNVIHKVLSSCRNRERLIKVECISNLRWRCFPHSLVDSNLCVEERYFVAFQENYRCFYTDAVQFSHSAGAAQCTCGFSVGYPRFAIVIYQIGQFWCIF